MRPGLLLVAIVVADGRLQRELGTVPVCKLLLRYSAVSLVSRPNCEGIGPCRLPLLLMANPVRPVSRPIVVGIDPAYALPWIQRPDRAVSSPICVGTVPLILQSLRPRYVSASRPPI